MVSQNRRMLLTLFVTLAVMSGVLVVSAAYAAQPPRIGIIQLVEHPALDASRDGFIAALKEAGLEDGAGVEIDFQNAQGDTSLLRSISEKFVSERYDLIYAITTPAVQTVASMTEDIPIVFAAVRDPIAAGVVDSFAHPGGNLTGTTHWTPVSDQIGLILEVMPEAKNIGVVFNAGEVNSASQVADAHVWAKKVGIDLVERSVSNTAEVQQAAQSLIGQVDILYIPTDNTVVAALESVIKVAEENRLPLVAADMATAARGALAAYGADFLQLGEQAGRIAVRILNGEDPAEIPVETQEQMDLALNLTAAKRIGFTIPQSVIEKAKIKY